LRIGVISMAGIDLDIPPELINPFTREQILAHYQNGEDVGTVRIDFTNQPESNDDDAESQKLTS
jgi:hypothetical protein